MNGNSAIKRLITIQTTLQKIKKRIDNIEEQIDHEERERARCMIGITRSIMKRHVEQNKTLKREIAILAAVDERLTNQASANEKLSKELVSLVTYFKDAVIPKERQLAPVFVPAMTPQTAQVVQKAPAPKPLSHARQVTHLNDSAGSFITATATPVTRDVVK